MQAKVYWGSKSARRYLLLPSGNPDFSKVPPALLEELGELRYDREVNLAVTPKLIGIPTNDAERYLRLNGYFVGEWGTLTKEHFWNAFEG